MKILKTKCAQRYKNMSNLTHYINRNLTEKTDKHRQAQTKENFTTLTKNEIFSLATFCEEK